MSRIIRTADQDKVYRARLRQEAEGGNRVSTTLYGPWQTLGAAKACVTRWTKHHASWGSSDSYWTNTWTIEVATGWSEVEW